MMLKQLLLAGGLAVMGSITAWAPTSTEAASPTESVTDKDFATQPRAAWQADDPADSLYRAANDQLSHGDFRAAARTFARIVERYPQSAYAGDAFVLESIRALPARYADRAS